MIVARANVGAKPRPTMPTSLTPESAPLLPVLRYRQNVTLALWCLCGRAGRMGLEVGVLQPIAHSPLPPGAKRPAPPPAASLFRAVRIRHVRRRVSSFDDGAALRGLPLRGRPDSLPNLRDQGPGPRATLDKVELSTTAAGASAGTCSAGAGASGSGAAAAAARCAAARRNSCTSRGARRSHGASGRARRIPD